MIKTTDKLKTRFDKYDRMSMVFCYALIVINLLSMFYLKDYIFIGSIIIIILFFRIKNIEVNNKVHSIDDIDLFYNKANDQLKKYRHYSVLLASCILLLFNYLFHFCGLVDVVYNNIFSLEGKVFFLLYVELFFFGLSALAATQLFEIISLYDFRSSSIFASKNKYLIRVWNFLYYRRAVYDCADGEKSYFEIWKENGNVIVVDKIGYIKKEISALDDAFLKKIYLYFLYPYDFGGNSNIETDYLIKKGTIFLGFLFPIVLNYFFNGFQNIIDLAIIGLICLFVYIFWMLLVNLWNWISRKNLLNQIKVIFPLLINEELENRKSKRKYKRPHRYK